MQFSKIQIKIDGYYIRVEKEKLNNEVSVDLYDFNNKTRTDNDECICKTTEERNIKSVKSPLEKQQQQTVI